MKNCSDCIHLEYDELESSNEEYEYCLKGHELLLSMKIPEECKEFESLW